MSGMGYVSYMWKMLLLLPPDYVVHNNPILPFPSDGGLSEAGGWLITASPELSATHMAGLADPSCPH